MNSCLPNFRRHRPKGQRRKSDAYLLRVFLYIHCVIALLIVFAVLCDWGWFGKIGLILALPLYSGTCVIIYTASLGTPVVLAALLIKRGHCQPLDVAIVLSDVILSFVQWDWFLFLCM
jgi:hypothetical protein